MYSPTEFLICSFTPWCLLVNLTLPFGYYGSLYYLLVTFTVRGLSTSVLQTSLSRLIKEEGVGV